MDSKTVQVNETGVKIRADAILIATGSKPGSIPVEGIDGPDVMDSKQALSLTSLPASVVVIGGGVIGVEFAQFLAAMGTRVTILEMMPGLVPGVDREVASLLEKRTIMSGIDVVTGASVKGIARMGAHNVVTYTVGDKTATASAEKILLTVGRRPDFSLIDVDRVGVRHEKGAIVVDEHMQTNIPGIYAAGDVVGGIMLAHLASAEGECAVKNILGNREAMSYRAVPSCIYTSPEVASVGLTEEKAGLSHDIRVGRFPFRANGKAVVLNDLEGLVKIISDGILRRGPGCAHHRPSRHGPDCRGRTRHAQEDDRRGFCPHDSPAPHTLRSHHGGRHDAHRRGHPRALRGVPGTKIKRFPCNIAVQKKGGVSKTPPFSLFQTGLAVLPADSCLFEPSLT